MVKSYQDYREAFAELLDPAKWPIEWLDEEIALGRATTFCDDEACIIAALRQFPGGMIEVHGLCATGGLAAIKVLVTQAEEWGRQNGATLASIASRSGWVRTMASEGYAEAQVMIEKDLSDGA